MRRHNHETIILNFSQFKHLKRTRMHETFQSKVYTSTLNNWENTRIMSPTVIIHMIIVLLILDVFYQRFENKFHRQFDRFSLSLFEAILFHT